MAFPPGDSCLVHEFWKTGLFIGISVNQEVQHFACELTKRLLLIWDDSTDSFKVHSEFNDAQLCFLDPKNDFLEADSGEKTKVGRNWRNSG